MILFITPNYRKVIKNRWVGLFRKLWLMGENGVQRYSSTRMKASIFLMLALVAVVSSSTSFEKVELGARVMSRVTSKFLLGQRQEELCNSLCFVHFVAQHICILGIEKLQCDEDDYPVGPMVGCYCCIPLVSG
ncbi:hypothetical protein FHG87_008175 [Trinorchestia longiramus]|nr:hypothetical protein FHG87_008175 [Trinorchestia longiramus]